MPRRKEIKGIAAGFVSHFISRINDINGYWAMGILHKYALNNLSTSVEIDVLTHVISPGNQAFIRNLRGIMLRQRPNKYCLIIN